MLKSNQSKNIKKIYHPANAAIYFSDGSTRYLNLKQ